MCTTTVDFSSASFAADGPNKPPTSTELEELLDRALASAEPMNRYRTELLRVARDDAPSAQRLHLKLSAVAVATTAVLAGDGRHSLPCLEHLTGALIDSKLTVRGDEACVARALDRLTWLAAGSPDRPDGVQGEVNWVQAVAVAYAMARYLSACPNEIVQCAGPALNAQDSADAGGERNLGQHENLRRHQRSQQTVRLVPHPLTGAHRTRR